jgi:hypothetical protein
MWFPNKTSEKGVQVAIEESATTGAPTLLFSYKHFIKKCLNVLECNSIKSLRSPGCECPQTAV